MDAKRTSNEINNVFYLFEQRKIQDLKAILQCFILIILKMSVSAVDILSYAYQDLLEIDESVNAQVPYKI